MLCLSSNGMKFLLTFILGDAISLYGLVNTTGAPYLVQVDNNTSSSYDARRTESFQKLLYHANNLGPGSHTLTFTCQPPAQQTCGIDYALVYSTAGNHNRSVTTSLMTSEPR